MSIKKGASSEKMYTEALRRRAVAASDYKNSTNKAKPCPTYKFECYVSITAEDNVKAEKKIQIEGAEIVTVDKDEEEEEEEEE